MTWQDKGACVGRPSAIFFPRRGENASRAKAVCAGCPVRDECLEYALANGERFGVWGGKSERERRRIRAERRSQAV